jgi:D-3-phosphoglycerate dehydrogenase
MGSNPELATDPVVENLILDLLEWISKPQERTYEEVLDAWRTSCPRLPVWEDATDRRLVTTEVVDGRALVKPTAAGLAYLVEQRPPAGRAKMGQVRQK